MGAAFWAVVGASIFAFAATALALLPLWAIGLPVPIAEGTTGQGWPWRIEGPWSFFADIGPLLCAGSVFAYGIEAFTIRHTGVPTRRLPIALTAATLGWVTLNGTTNAGVLSGSGLATFVALVIVTREMSVRERRPWRWTPITAWGTLILVPVLAGASLSYAFLHPLVIDNAQLQSTKDGVARIHTRVGNEGRAPVTVLAVAVPGVRTRALTDPVDPSLGSYSYEYDMNDPDAGMVPIAGKTVEHEYGRSMELVISARCPSSRIVDRVHVRLRVLGRTVDQVVRISPPVPVGCV